MTCANSITVFRGGNLKLCGFFSMVNVQLENVRTYYYLYVFENSSDGFLIKEN
jgi:hypothetical protein